MKQLVVISGKGGTGKTVITASFAALAKSAVFADCDVDAADLHLLLHPKVKERYEFKSGKTARINKNLCSKCNRCIEVCRFNAITKDFIIDSISCEGCGICNLVCPTQTISMEENLSGEWFISDTKYGTLVHAKLGIASENSGKLVALVREKAKKKAQEENKNYVIIDGPPGIGCPVIASIGGVDIALIVVEPTLSGIHDMERVISVTNHFGVKAAVCINKYDLNLENTKAIEEYCQKSNIKAISKIPFDKAIVEALVKGIPVVEYSNNSIATKEIKNLWSNLKDDLNKSTS